MRTLGWRLAAISEAFLTHVSDTASLPRLASSCLAPLSRPSSLKIPRFLSQPDTFTFSLPPLQPDASPMQPTTMEADLSAHSTFLTPDMFVNRADSPLTTIKMEDLQQIPATPVVDPELLSVDTPRPATNESKPTKKRKSWGQVLPEPKTSLPPRKRAKTADEKEQRRIERVKRNRLAAHNSRERKRQETENLQGINDALERRVKALEEQNKKMAAELRTYRHIVGSVAPPSLESFDFIAPVEAFDAASPDTINPLQASASTPGTMTDMDTPVDSATQPSTPFAEATATEPDQTQHSAAMLWDLQCQSGSASQQAPNASQRFRWVMAFLLAFSLQASLATSLSSTFSTLTLLLTRARPRTPSCRRSRASSTTSSSRTRQTRRLSALSTLLNSLMTPSSTCMPAQAQLLLATSLAMRRWFSVKLGQRLTGSGLGPGVGRGGDRSSLRLRGLQQGANGERASLADEIKRCVMELDNYLGRPSKVKRQKRVSGV